MQTITERELEEALASNKKVILQFSADWCGPCKRFTPILESFAKSYDELSVFKVDIGMQANLAKRFDVQSIPKIVLFDNGEEIKSAVGLMNEGRLQTFIND